MLARKPPKCCVHGGRRNPFPQNLLLLWRDRSSKIFFSDTWCDDATVMHNGSGRNGGRSAERCIAGTCRREGTELKRKGQKGAPHTSIFNSGSPSSTHEDPRDQPPLASTEPMEPMEPGSMVRIPHSIEYKVCACACTQYVLDHKPSLSAASCRRCVKFYKSRLVYVFKARRALHFATTTEGALFLLSSCSLNLIDASVI